MGVDNLLLGFSIALVVQRRQRGIKLAFNVEMLAGVAPGLVETDMAAEYLEVAEACFANARALDQAQPDDPLQGRDLLRDRRLRVAEALGRALDAAGVRDRKQGRSKYGAKAPGKGGVK